MMDIKKDPFRLFFPIGCLLGILGNLIWPLFVVSPNWLGFQPESHRSLMIGGFLSAFVVGFLMTAIPRFTKTPYAKSIEIIPALVALLFSQTAILFKQYQLFYFSTFLVYLTLVIFAARRFKNRKANPPSTFIFVGLGILIFLISSLVLSIRLNGSDAKFFELLFFQGGTLSLVVGIGGRLIPGLLGWTDIVMAQRKIYERPLPFLQVVPKMILIVLLLFISSFIVEHFVNIGFGRTLRAVAVTYIAAAYWKIYLPPKEKSILTLFVWLSSWFVLIGSWIYALIPSLGTHALHLIFVGGFSLLTIMVASRVTLAHGGGEKIIEKKSMALLLTGCFFVIAALGRVLAGIYPAGYTNSLAIVASIWLVGLILWSLYFIPKMLKPAP